MLDKTFYTALLISIGIIIGIGIPKEKGKHIPICPILIGDTIKKESLDTLEYEEELLVLLKKYKIQNPLIVLAQAKLESGNFTSNLFLKYHNFVNMKIPGQRPTSGTNSPNHNYSEYEDLNHGVLDYAIWQSSYARNLNEEQYYSRLVELGFAEDTMYIHKLRPIVGQLKQKYGE